jgi:hypothetical protein
MFQTTRGDIADGTRVCATNPSDVEFFADLLCKGKKEVNWDGGFWDDHDEDCHGRIDDLIDDEDCMEGFMWSCCEEPGDDEGCKSTKHKAHVNEIRNPSPVIVSVPKPPSRKRKAEQQM